MDVPEFTLFPGNAPVAINAGEGGAEFFNAGPSPAFYGPGQITPASPFIAMGDTVTLYGTQYFTVTRAGMRADIDYKLLAQVNASPTDPGAGSSTGVSLVPMWAPNKDYLATQIVQAEGRMWLARSDHRSSSTFSQDRDLLWDVLIGSATGIVTLTLQGAPIVVGVTKRSWVAPVDGTLLAVSADSDATLTLDITRNGVSIFSTVANRPVMNSANGYVARERLPDTVVFKAGDKFQILPTSLQHSSRTPGAGTASVTLGSTLTNPTIAVPTVTSGSAVAVGDIIFLAGKINTADTTATTIAPPSGFAEVGTGLVKTNVYEYHVFWKRADSGDVAASTFSLVVTGTISGYVFDLVTYRDMLGSGSPIDVTATLTPAFVSSLTFPALVPTVADEVRVAFVVPFSGQTVTTPTSMVSRTARIFDRNLTGQPATTGTDVAPLSSTNYAGALVLTLKPGVGDDTTTYGNVNLRYVPSIAATSAPTVVDTTAPSTPTSPVAVANTATQVKISWGASTDNVAVAGYEVKRGGVVIKPAVTTLSVIDATAAPSTAYVYSVRAFDAAGNFSAAATASSVTTPAAPGAGSGAYTIDGIYMRDPAGAIFTPYGFNMGVSQSIGGNFSGSDESVTNVTTGSPHIAELVEWGCNAVRMFVYVSDSTSWINTLGRTAAWNKIKDAINLYRAAGLVVIVSPADMTGSNAGRVADHEEDTVEFLQTVGAAYASDSGVWWGANEPAVSLVAGRTGNYNTDWLAVHERMYAALRTGNPNIYIMDGPGAAQDPGPTQVSGTDFAGNPWSLKRVYDPDMGPAFMVGKSNVLFGLHNYGWQAGPSSPLSAYISAYTTYLTNVHNAGLAMYLGEADTLLNSRPEIVVGDDRRHRFGFQSMVELAPQFATGFMFWYGTSIDLTGPKYDRTSGNSQGRPWWYGGSSTRLSDSGSRFWNLLHAAATVPVPQTYPTISSASYTVGVTLTATPGVWEPTGTITYQWRRTISSTHTLITGETNPTYVVQPADIGAGYRLSCVVQCTNSNGSAAQDTGYATSA